MKMKPARFSQMQFLILWLIGHVLSWGAIYSISEWGYLDGADDMAGGFLIGAIVGGGITLMQKFLLEQNYGIRITGWVRLSIVGWILGGWLMIIVTDLLNFSYSMPVAAYVVLLVAPSGLIQAYLLRRYVGQTWVWFLAVIISALVFGSIMEMDAYDESLGLFALAGAGEGAVTGLALLWMFATEQGEKLKNGVVDR